MAKENFIISVFSGQPLSLQPEQVELRIFYLDKFEQVETGVKKVTDKACIITIPSPRAGFYNLVLSPQLNVDLVINPETEDSLFIEIGGGGIQFSSMEQAAFGILKNLAQQKSQAIETYNEKRISISIVDPMYYHKKERLKLQSDSVKEYYNKRMLDSLAAYRSTYTYQYLLPLLTIPTRYARPGGYSQYDNHHAYYHAHMFDGIPLSDEKILYNPLLREILGEYIVNFFGEFTDDYREGTDYLMQKCTHPAVKEYVLGKLLVHLYAKNEYELIKDLFAKYYNGCVDEINNQTIRDIMEFPLLVNREIEDFPLYLEATGRQQVLSALLTEKPNILIFWREDCSHCRETLSIMNAGASRYAAYTIITVLLSENPLGKGTDIRLPESWTQLYCGDQLANVLARLKIRKTPFFIQVKKDLKIEAFYSSYESIRF